MSISEHVVDLSRLQFAMTALYHFLFVPLTIGLAILLGIMETIYYLTGREIWKVMTRFWGILFGINFAMGVATGITMEFQFGTNWAYYSHYVGDIFGAPLAIEGLMAFFLEATFVGLFFFGWDKLSRGAHLTVTWLLALGSNLSALWILIANGWMQHPVGAYFDHEAMRMEVSNFYEVMFNPVAQAKFVHTVSAAYVTASIFVLAISAFYLLRKRNAAFAKRSMLVASVFGLACALSAVVLGDESGYLANENQKMKIAALEGMWETEPAPAGLTVIGFPDKEAKSTRVILKVPYLLGLMATRSFDQPLLGINDIVQRNKARIIDGIHAYQALQILKEQPNDVMAKAVLNDHVSNLGFSLLLKKYTNNVVDATATQIDKAAWDTVPNVGALFWSFRVMVACGLYFILLFATSCWLMVKNRYQHPWFLKIAFCSLPLPWLAAELGWFVAESGRQPWVIEGILPTRLGVSSILTSEVVISFVGFVLLYSALAVVEVMLMIKYIRLGPDGYYKQEERAPRIDQGVSAV